MKRNRGQYRSVVSSRVFSEFPISSYTFKPDEHRRRQIAVVLKNDDGQSAARLKNGKKARLSDTIVRFDEITKEVYASKQKWQSRRLPIVRVRLDVPIDYHFGGLLGVYVKPLLKS